MSFKRQIEFRRNENLEILLKELNNLLSPAEYTILKNYKMPKHPVILIIGAPRSGTTLILQWLVKTGRFAYPTNLLARFYGAPFIGAKIQQLLTAPEYNFRNELLDFTSKISFESELGKTKGALAPNEFWYFWRRFIPNIEPEYLEKEDLKKIDSKQFLAELAAIESVFDKPFVMKGIILQYNLTFLSSIFNKVLFIFVNRHPFFNIQSLLEARMKFYGNMNEWYSVKPKEYKKLQRLTPFEQVAGQVYYTNLAIEKGLRIIDSSRWLQVSYEDFCSNPKQIFSQIANKLSAQGYELERNYTEPKRFRNTNKIRFSETDSKKIIHAYKIFSGIDIRV